MFHVRRICNDCASRTRVSLEGVAVRKRARSALAARVAMSSGREVISRALAMSQMRVGEPIVTRRVPCATSATLRRGPCVVSGFNRG
jgi:hypothetical protein